MRNERRMSGSGRGDERPAAERWRGAVAYFHRRDGAERYRTMTSATDEFIRRFMLHVLPQGFHRIRHYGLLAAPAARPISPAPANSSRSRRRPMRAGRAGRCPSAVSMLRRTHDHHRDFPALGQPRAPPHGHATNREVPP